MRSLPFDALEPEGTSVRASNPTKEPHTLAGDMVVSLSSRRRVTALGVASISSNVADCDHLSVQADYEVSAPIPVPPAYVAVVDTKPIQIWEGVVLALDGASMDVRLAAKMGALPDHTATIDLQWVHEQDQDLVKPGAVFYLTLFKKISHGSIQNSQEIRFRRRPSWNDAQIRRVQTDAEELVKRMVPGREA